MMKEFAFAFGLSLITTPVLAQQQCHFVDGPHLVDGVWQCATDTQKLCDAIKNAGVPLASDPTFLNIQVRIGGNSSAEFKLHCGEEK